MQPLLPESSTRAQVSLAMSKPSEDEKKRDEILKRMLQTPHKPHVAKKPAKKAEKKRSKKLSG